MAGLGDTRKREALFKGLHQVRGLLWDWTWRSPVWLDYEACAGRRQVPQEPTEHAWQGVGLVCGNSRESLKTGARMVPMSMLAQGNTFQLLDSSLRRGVPAASEPRDLV